MVSSLEFNGQGRIAAHVFVLVSGRPEWGSNPGRNNFKNAEQIRIAFPTSSNSMTKFVKANKPAKCLSTTLDQSLSENVEVFRCNKKIEI